MVPLAEDLHQLGAVGMEFHGGQQADVALDARAADEPVQLAVGDREPAALGQTASDVTRDVRRPILDVLLAAQDRSAWFRPGRGVPSWQPTQCRSSTGCTSRAKLNPRTGPYQGSIAEGVRRDASVCRLGVTVFCRSWHPTQERVSPGMAVNQLFGHVRGSFTGAVESRPGRFEAAHTGTIFLDEINSTTAVLQVKLLRVLQEREFERVGDTHTIAVDTRVIAASNRDLYEQVQEGGFREDLYYRLNVIPIELPPLRERREDIPELVGHFLSVYSEENDRYVAHVDRRAMEFLQQYDWPGNVRELQNYVERAVVMAPGDELTLDMLPEAVLGQSSGGNTRLDEADLPTLTSELVKQGLAGADPRKAICTTRLSSPSRGK